MRTLTAAALAALVLTAGTAEAANCRKGKPCGNSCIAQNRVCRIDAPRPSFVERPRVVEAPAASRGPAEVTCRWGGRTYRVPAALCTDGGGFVVR